MNKTARHIITKGILLFIFFTQSIGVQASSQEIQVELNQNQQRGINPIIEKDTTLVPLRSVSDLLGASTSWDALTKTIMIIQDDSKRVSAAQA